MVTKGAAALVWLPAFAALLLPIGSCAPNVGSDQVAVRFYPPPGKLPAIQQIDETLCTRNASGYVRLYVECMQERGYQPEIIGQGGVHMTVAQLPMPPPQAVPQITALRSSPAIRQASSCESQANQCQQCQNGLYRGTGFLCQYDSFSECRSSILRFCKENPSSDKGLEVRGGKLTNDQAYELMMSCPNVPHGSIPYSGSPPAPGSKKWQQCQAFEKTYVACSMLVRVGRDRGRCFRETYSGP